MLFFARDPGAADILIEIYKNLSGNKVFWAKDYARDSLKKKKIKFFDFNKIVSDNITQSSDRNIISNWLSELSIDTIITGTTHLEDFTDRLIWEEAGWLGIKTIAVLDQWLRVDERFQVEDKFYRPDFILAPSEIIASDLNRKKIPKEKALSIGSPFLSEVARLSEARADKKKEVRGKIQELFGVSFNKLVIYVSEPQMMLEKLGVQYSDVTYNEIELFKLLQDALVSNQDPKDVLLLVKLHPKEDASQYADLHSYLVKDEIDKYDLLAAADIVVGTKSMMLLEALFFDCRVLSIDFWNLENEQLISNRLGFSEHVKSEEELLELLTTNKKSSFTKKEVEEKLCSEEGWVKRIEQIISK